MGKAFLRHEVVRFDGLLNVIPMDTDSNPHDHVLRPFCDLVANPQQVGPFERLKTKVLIIKVSVVDNGRIQLL